MAGYLLDTNIVSFWFDEAKPEHAAVSSRLHALPSDTHLMLSAVSLGEIEYGHRALGPSVDAKREAALLAFVGRRLPITLSVDKHTRTAYGSLRARLFEKYGPAGRRKKGLRPDELIDPTSALALGIQENDLWIAAQAIEHNLVLVTHDRMSRLRQVAEELQVEDWAA